MFYSCFQISMSLLSLTRRRWMLFFKRLLLHRISHLNIPVLIYPLTGSRVSQISEILPSFEEGGVHYSSDIKGEAYAMFHYLNVPIVSCSQKYLIPFSRFPHSCVLECPPLHVLVVRLSTPHTMALRAASSYVAFAVKKI